MDEKLLDVTAVAALLNVSRRTVWVMRDSGRLPSPVRINRCVRWRQSDLLKWISDGCPKCRSTTSR